MAETSVTWTEERLELLKKLWGEGLSASQIAAELGGGMTRNAVLGKSHRLGLVRNTSAVISTPRPTNVSRPPSPPATAKLPRQDGPTSTPVTKTVSQPPSEQPKAAPPPVDVTSPHGEGLTIMELREGTCRWPLGDPTTPQFRYCGGHAIPSLPYCSHHAQIAYQPITERKRLRA
jgi:GcrA cell cycle regulator